MDWSDRIGRRVRLRDLHIVLAVAESGSMAKASARLSISHPVVSKAISELEQASDDAHSLELLVRAKREAGDDRGADAALRQLLAIHASTMDSVLVVEPARLKSAVSATASGSH